jgi:hypothetical protein
MHTVSPQRGLIFEHPIFHRLTPVAIEVTVLRTLWQWNRVEKRFYAPFGCEIASRSCSNIAASKAQSAGISLAPGESRGFRLVKIPSRVAAIPCDLRTGRDIREQATAGFFRKVCAL